MAQKNRYLLSLITRESDYQLEEAAEAERTARQLGVDLQILYADGDAVAQTQQLLQEVYLPAARRPEAIIVQPVGTSLAQVARVAASTGIGWAVLNRDAEYLEELRSKNTAPVFEVTSDHVEIGRIQGRQMAAILPNGGTALYLEGPATSPTAQQRKLGLTQGKPANITLRSIRSQWGKHYGIEAVKSWLRLPTSKEYQIDMIAAQSDTLAIAARDAFQTQGSPADRDRWLNLPYLGSDGCPNTGKKWTDQKLLTATVQMPILSGVAISMMLKALQGETVDARTVVMPQPYPELNRLRPVS